MKQSDHFRSLLFYGSFTGTSPLASCVGDRESLGKARGDHVGKEAGPFVVRHRAAGTVTAEVEGLPHQSGVAHGTAEGGGQWDRSGIRAAGGQQENGGRGDKAGLLDRTLEVTRDIRVSSGHPACVR